jgi:nucleotide-binding universal stress UspA family protein
VFKNILIPTDGSPIASKAVNAGLELAKQLGAAVTGYCAFETTPVRNDDEGYDIDGIGADRALAMPARAIGEDGVAEMAKAAASAGVPFTTVVHDAKTPHDGIIKTAIEHKCDLIVMASHGRSGLAGLVLGSVTNKVLSQSNIPVLVFR